MQQLKTIFWSVTAMLSLMPGLAMAGNYTSMEIGKTSLILHNSAPIQNQHYVGRDEDLLNRIRLLMCDVDQLMGKLHALPAELNGSPPVEQPVHDELLRLIEVGLGNNPELKPLRSELAVLAAKTRQSGAMNDPLASFQLMNFPAPQLPFDDTAMTQVSLGISQKFESYGKRKLRRSISRFEEELTQLSLAQRELDLIGQIADQYFAMVSTSASLDVLEENNELLDLLVELAERKYALGVIPQAQVLSAQVAQTNLAERAIKLEKLLAQQTEMLLGLLGHPPDFQPELLTLTAIYALPAALDFDEQKLLAEAFERRPDYQRLSVMESQQELMLELAARGYRPDFTISASYGMRWGKRDFFSAGISFPLFTNKEERQDAKVQENYAMLSVTEDRKRIVENMLATKLATLAVDVERIEATAAIYREGLIPQARLALDSTIAAFATDNIGLSELLAAQQTLLNYELELEQQYIDYLRTLAELQVITAGAFDPGPFLAPQIGEPADPVTSQPILLDSSGTVEIDGLAGQPTVRDFIDALGLPTLQVAPPISTDRESSDSGAFEGFRSPKEVSPVTPEEQIGETTGPVEVNADASDEAAPDSDDEVVDAFYRPFKPIHEK